MCGILGISLWSQTSVERSCLESILAHMFKLSVSRGKEAAGLMVRTPEELHVFKRPMIASRMVRSSQYREFLDRAVGVSSVRAPFAAVGHARLVTNGVHGIDSNNQPVASNGAVAVHNGIIVNDRDLWRRHPDLLRHTEVDTEIIPALVQKFRAEGESIEAAIARTYEEIEGAASIAMLVDDWSGLALATNTGSIYFAKSETTGLLLFASERYFLERLLISNASAWTPLAALGAVHKLEPGKAIFVDFNAQSLKHISLAEAQRGKQGLKARRDSRVQLIDEIEQTADRRRALRRCKRCVLPATVPGITFDADGLCSYCQRHRPHTLRGIERLRELANQHRRTDGRPDCIVGLSGGRDSCYGLHLIKTELGLNPIAFTYDWALVTDLARRNQSRLCSKLGVEHIIISADIHQKRENIRLNVNAWLRRPELGLIPLLMAGDKMYFYYYQMLRRRMDIRLAVLCGNRYERTDFKTGFCGIFNKKQGAAWRPYDISLFNKIRLAWYYAKGFLENPAYLNRSLPDTLLGFYASSMIKHDFEWLFEYVPWDEREITEILHHRYGWESAGDTRTTWRIGDGTAAFYNYIYYVVAGFTEHDTFRSNQIREGVLTREEALALLEEENRPRYDNIRDYAHLIGFNFDYAMAVINQIPKLY